MSLGLFHRSVAGLGVGLSFALALACTSEEPADDAGASDGGTAETGDGDGDPGDGDPGDGDGDTGDGDGDACAPPDPPLAQSLDGSWVERPPPALGFACALDSGDGPTWNEGLHAAEVEAGIDHVAIGNDGKLYAAGWVNDGGLGALVVGVGLGNGQNSELWARSWTYDGEEWPARSMAVTSNGRIWLNSAPEHLLAVGEGGELLDGPFEAFAPGSSYIGDLARGDDMLLIASTQREQPPNCIGGTRLQLSDPSTAEALATTPAFFTNTVLGLDGDHAGGAWMAVLDLNGAGTTINHYTGDGTELGSFAATNDDTHVFGGDVGIASNGDVILALKGPFIVDVQRYDPDGNQLWAVTLPNLGDDVGNPRLELEGGDEAVVAYDINGGLGLARVLGDGSVDWAGRWSCGGAVEVHDVAVSVDGADIWVGGVQASTAWVANLQ